MNISREEIILILQIKKHQFQDFNYGTQKMWPQESYFNEYFKES